MKLHFSNGVVENFTIILSHRNKRLIDEIHNIKNINYKACFNAANEISFDVYKKLDNTVESNWSHIENLSLIYVKELDEFFQIEVSTIDSKSIIKKVTGTSLCEAELSQVNLYNIEINTEHDIARDNYTITKFYNEKDPQGSLLNRVLEKVPHYSIKHVDSSLCNLQRSFSINGTTIYDFLIGECSEQFNCLFLFDTTERSISVYDLYTVCNSCGYRGEFDDICPQCGSNNLKYYGEDTLIYVDSCNLTDEISFDTEVSSIKNCFRLVAGDDNMTASIISSNPNGSQYIYYFSQDIINDMPEELANKLSEYNELYDSYEEEYQQLSEYLYDCIDKILYYRSNMMPSVDISSTNATSEAQKITYKNLNPVALSVLNKNTTVNTVNSALKNYVKVFVKTGYVKVDVYNSSFAFKGVENGKSYGIWTGNFKVTNYSDSDDIAYSETITIEINDDYGTFLNQKIIKNISDDDESLYDVLSIEDLKSFKNALTYYSYTRLESFFDAIQGVINILIEEGQAGIDSKYYELFYTRYYNKLVACQEELNKRSIAIKEYEEKYEQLSKKKQDIQNSLNLKSYLGETLYQIFCAYRREDTYQNDNYISDGLDNTEIFKNALDFIENAKKEIVKSGESQHSISANLYNLLLMKEFEPLVDYFELGNWIRICVNEKLYRLRLIEYCIDFENLQTINTVFSNVKRLHNGVSDVKDIIQSARSMSTNYAYISKQADKGNAANEILKNFEDTGLDSGLITIKNNDKEEIVFNNHGLLCRTFDDTIDSYSKKQAKITHNTIAFTKDNWKSTEICLGEHSYLYYSNGVLKNGLDYGLSAKFVQAGVVSGSQIIGGEIYSQNYSSNVGTYMNLNDGSFSFAGGKLKFDGTDISLKGVNISWTDIENADENVIKFLEDSDYVTSSQATTITKNVVTSSYIKGLNLSVGDEIKMGNNVTMSWSQITNSENVALLKDIPSDAYINQLTKETINKEYINSLKITAGDVSAENISGLLFTGKIIETGSKNNKKGCIKIYDESDYLLGEINSSGISSHELVNEDIYSSTLNNGSVYIKKNNSDCFRLGNYSLNKHAVTALCSMNDGYGIGLGYKKKSDAGGYDICYALSDDNFMLGEKTRHSFWGDVSFKDDVYSTKTYYSINNKNNLEYVGLYGAICEGKNALCCSDNIFAEGEIGSSGVKYQIVSTSYGNNIMYSFETTKPYFADMGSNIIPESGSIEIPINKLFMETIDTSNGYLVFVTSSTGNVSVTKNSDNFVVSGDKNTTFDWLLCANQKKYSI